jgi:ComF family protein
MKRKFSGITAAILDVILPAVCVNCGAEVLGPKLLCSRCAESIIIRKAPKRIGSRFLFAAADYNDPSVQRLVKAMKYSGIWKAGYPISEIIMSHLEISGFKQSFPITENAFIVPIPIHFVKRWKRGFNQSEILADIVAKKIGIPVVKALRRRRWTPPQSRMASDGIRFLNIKGCFSLSRSARKIPRRSAIIILDDIVTSGETMKEAAGVLKPLRPSAIFFVSAASR